MKPPIFADWLRYVLCWLIAVSAAVFLIGLIVPIYGRWNDGKPWMWPVILAAIPSVYGGAIGFGMPGRAPWRLLLLGGALTAPLFLRGWHFMEFLQAFAMTAAAPAPAAALASWIARRSRLSPNARLGASLALGLATIGLFAVAERLKWVPQIGILCEYPPPGTF